MKRLCLALLFTLFFTAAAFAAIDLNTATKEQLDALPGIGPVKAEAIIKYRSEKGPFKSVEQLKEVSGIGEKIFQNIKSDLMIGAAPAVKAEPAAAVTPVEKKLATEVKTEVKAEGKQPEAAAKEPAAETKK